MQQKLSNEWYRAYTDWKIILFSYPMDKVKEPEWGRALANLILVLLYTNRE